MAVDNYTNVQKESSSGRQAEAHALIRCALMLDDALTTKDNDVTYEAARLNYRLWLMFYSDIAEKRVQLPDEVERNVLALAAYVVKTGPAAFAGDEKVIQALININRHIAAGLLDDGAIPDLANEAGPGNVQPVSTNA